MCDRQYHPPNDPSKNQPTADCPTAALAHRVVETRISVNIALIASPPTMCMWTTNDDLCLCWRRRAADAVVGGS